MWSRGDDGGGRGRLNRVRRHRPDSSEWYGCFGLCRRRGGGLNRLRLLLMANDQQSADYDDGQDCAADQPSNVFAFHSFRIASIGIDQLFAGLKSDGRRAKDKQGGIINHGDRGRVTLGVLVISV